MFSDKEKEILQRCTEIAAHSRVVKTLQHELLAERQRNAELQARLKDVNARYDSILTKCRAEEKQKMMLSEELQALKEQHAHLKQNSYPIEVVKDSNELDTRIPLVRKLF